MATHFPTLKTTLPTSNARAAATVRPAPKPLSTNPLIASVESEWNGSAKLQCQFATRDAYVSARMRQMNASVGSGKTEACETAEALAAKEWDSDPGVRPGWSCKENYVAVRSREMTGQFKTYNS